MTKTQKMVYFLKPIGLRGPIKIGCSVAANVRLQYLSTISPLKLELIVSTPGCHADENKLHRYFAPHRRHGEWFEASQQLEHLIDAVRSGASIETAFLGVRPKPLPIIIVPKFVSEEAIAAKEAARAAKLVENQAKWKRGEFIRARKKEREAKIAELMRGGKRTYQQIADIVGISRQRVHQIHEQSLPLPAPAPQPPGKPPQHAADQREREPRQRDRVNHAHAVLR